MNDLLLTVDNLHIIFNTSYGKVKAVSGISYKLNLRETIGIVGESGSGKTVSSLALLNLVPSPGKITEGEIYFLDKNILKLPPSKMREIRGKEISMIFQDPFTSLNPVFTIGEQIAEMLRVHNNYAKKEAKDETLKLLKKVNLPNPELRVKDYPHNLSGGMRQRVMIAIAISCNPKVLIADEPTTALDVTIQAQILDLLTSLKQEFQMSLILITHNLALVAENCDRVLVMYAGLIMEEAKTLDIFDFPSHPYTIGLINCLPRIDKKINIKPIPGNPPNLIHPPAGCPFAPRCEKKFKKCDILPPLIDISENHKARCWLYK